MYFIIYLFFIVSKTIIFDLDETLIHSNKNLKKPSDVKINMKFPYG